MKATLEFNLPEERTEHRLALDGQAWYCVVWDVSQQLRQWLRRGYEFKTVDEALVAVQNAMIDAQAQHQVDIGWVE